MSPEPKCCKPQCECPEIRDSLFEEPSPWGRPGAEEMLWETMEREEGENRPMNG